jgi:hypothetical protein
LIAGFPPVLHQTFWFLGTALSGRSVVKGV